MPCENALHRKNCELVEMYGNDLTYISNLKENSTYIRYIVWQINTAKIGSIPRSH